jgi:hypothetical protein
VFCWSHSNFDLHVEPNRGRLGEGSHLGALYARCCRSRFGGVLFPEGRISSGTQPMPTLQDAIPWIRNKAAPMFTELAHSRFVPGDAILKVVTVGDEHRHSCKSV